MKKILGVVLAIFISVLFIGCKENKEHSKNNLKQIDLVLDWYPNAVHSFIYTAIEKGYYKDEGLKVNIKFPSNATDPLALVASKKATIGMYYLQDLITAKTNEEVPVKSIGAVIQSPLGVIISLKDKRINRPVDLENKTIGYSGSPLSEAMVREMVKYDGGNLNKVNLMDVGFDIISSMTTKKVDATTSGMVNHEVPVMKHQGFDVNYFYPCDYGIPNYYELLFVANDETINNNPNLLKKFLKASKKGFEYVKMHEDEGLDILLENQKQDNFPLTKSVEKQSLDILTPKMETKEKEFLQQDTSVWQNNIDWLYKNNLIKTKLKTGDLFVDIN